MTGEVRYFAADAEYQAELTRRRIAEAECDPLTVRYLLRLGVGGGWRCLEVGAGAGSIVRWLSDRVGPNGSVVAADIDTRFLEDLSERNIQVRRSTARTRSLAGSTPRLRSGSKRFMTARRTRPGSRRIAPWR